MKILNLIVKEKWYNMIESGIKNEEYREFNWYWIKKFAYCYRWCTQNIINIGKQYNYCYRCPNTINFNNIFGMNYNIVCFHQRYTDKTMLFKLDDISIGIGNPEWGAPQNKEVFIFKLGNRIL